MTLRATDVAAAVRRRYGAEKDNIGPEWAALDELTHTTTGYGPRRADLFLVRAWAGRPKGHERILVEVKVSRADLRAELADPTKMAAFARYAHRAYFATPAGLVKDTDDLGPGVGLLEVHPTGTTREVRRATRRPDPEPLPEGLVVEVFRRAARAEARTRTATAGDPAARVVALEARLTTALDNETRARNAAERDAGRLREWLARVAGVGGLPCICGALLARAKDANGSHMYGHRHADGSSCPDRWAQPDMTVLARRLGLEVNDEAIAS